jgi:hypothetical protein
MESFEQICEERDAMDARLQQWRSWARFVFGDGGPTAGLTDADLQRAVCARADVLDPILAEMQADSDAVDEEAERNSINTPEYTRRLCNLALTARHFLRERANLLPAVDAVDPSIGSTGNPTPRA